MKLDAYCYAFLLGILSGAIIGSGESASGAAAAIVRDSSGIQIVENSGPAWEEGEGWTVTTEPVVDIGLREGDPDYQLFEVMGAIRLSDGRIAVADGGSHRVRFYDPAGRFLADVGGDGEGPGEFRVLRGVWSYRGDSLLTWDSRLRRITVLTAEGSFGRSAVVSKAGRNPNFISSLNDGSLISFDLRISDPGVDVVQAYADFLRHSAEGTSLDSLGSFPLGRAHRIRYVDGGMMFALEGFGDKLSLGVSGDRIYLGLGKRHEVSVFRPDGTLARIVRWQGEDRTIGAGDIERYKQDTLAIETDEQIHRRLSELLSQIPFAEQYPAYGDIRADRLGNLWVLDFAHPGDAGPARWRVFDPRGRELGDITAPADLHIYEIGEDYLMGLERDEFDVEHVRMYGLEKD